MIKKGNKLDNLIKYNWKHREYTYRANALDKLLVDNVKNKNISAVSLTVLSVIECNITIGDNVCELTAKGIAELSGIHPNKIYTYLNELMHIGVLVKHEYKYRDAYYVNPKYIKRSNRISKETLDLFGIEYKID